MAHSIRVADEAANAVAHVCVLAVLLPAPVPLACPPLGCGERNQCVTRACHASVQLRECGFLVARRTRRGLRTRLAGLCLMADRRSGSGALSAAVATNADKNNSRTTD